MSRMMDRVLLLGKADAQMLEFEPARGGRAGAVPRLVEEAGRSTPTPAARSWCARGPAWAPGLYDEKLLRHIFGNLLSNAIKYSPQGGQVRSTCGGGGELVFEVADQGIGIPAGRGGHLFESFHRASNVGVDPGHRPGPGDREERGGDARRQRGAEGLA
jgi:signal transduction histidine kinase